MSSMDTERALPLKYWPLLLLYLLAALFFLANPSIIADLRNYSFDDGTYSHAYLLPFLILFLYWRAWKQQQLVLRWNPWFFSLFIACLLAFLWLQLAQQSLPSRILLPACLLLAFCSLYRINASLLVPGTMLWFMVPIWSLLNGILQKISVVAVSYMMSWTNVPTFVEGNYVHIPAGIFEIADGCSGLRYFIVSLALAVMFSFLNLKRKRSITLFFFVAILGSLVTNWVRIALLILIGDYTQMQSSLMDDHNMFGWYIYVPFIAILFYFGGFLDRDCATAPMAEPAANKPISSLPIVLVTASFVIFSTFSTNIISQQAKWYPIASIDVDGERQSETFNVISPVIFDSDNYYQQQLELDSSLIYIQRYFFSGQSDALRSNYYQNDVVPTNWQQQKTEYLADSSLVWVTTSGGQTGLIHYWHQIGPYQTASGLKIRLYRMQQAMMLKQNTELHWQFVYCQQADCQQETQLLLQLPRNIAAN